MDFRQILEESLESLGIEGLDDNPDDIPAGTDEKADDKAPEDEAAESEPAGDEDDQGESEDSEEVQEDDTPFIEIVDDSRIKLSDGTIVSAKDVMLRQADYTRKTQEIADERKRIIQEREDFAETLKELRSTYEEVSAWYDDRSAKPSDWIAEIASEAEDPTATIAAALYELAQQGVLDKNFVSSFGIDAEEMAEKAKERKLKTEIDELKTWREQQLEDERRKQMVSQQTARYESEWSKIKLDKDLDFDSPADELNAKRELLQYALENNLTKSLVDAYDLMTVRKPRVVKQAPEETSDVSDKKRASRAVTPKSAISGSAKRAKQKVSDREAILEAMEALSF